MSAVLYNKRGVSDYTLYDEAGIEARTGVRPEKYALLAALRGDPSDNLPGVPGVGEKTAAKLINQYGDLDSLFSHVGELSPKLRENLRTHVDQVRQNAELIPLIRDVPLDLHVEDLTLGGWDAEEARDTFAELELKAVWTRLSSLMDEGALGLPAGGLLGGSGAEGSARPDVAEVPPARVGAAPPDWLAVPGATVPATAGEAVQAIEQVVASARKSTGNVAVHAQWSGDPGRSPLSTLTLAAEVPGEGKPDPAVHLRGSGSLELLSDDAVVAALSSAVGPGGVGVIAHDAKELMRSLLPLGVDVVSLTMDTAVAAYLLDPSTDRYRLSDLAADHLGVEVDDGTGGPGQGAFALDAKADTGGDSDGTTDEAADEAAERSRRRSRRPTRSRCRGGAARLGARPAPGPVAGGAGGGGGVRPLRPDRAAARPGARPDGGGRDPRRPGGAAFDRRRAGRGVPAPSSPLSTSSPRGPST